MKNDTLLRVENLTIGFPSHGQLTPVVDHVSFTLERGEILGIVGESGSGKTMSALAMMSLLPKSAQIMEGKIYFEDQEILTASDDVCRTLKGTRMAMIFQEPMTSFNPVMTIGAQVEEMLRLHEKCSSSEYKERTILILQEVGLDEAEAVYQKYPHQLSGGMRQRAMIAMAMITGPQLLIADEPTTALDVTIQNKILMLLKKINQVHGTTILLVSHDLGVIKRVCNRALVMKEGKVVESGDAKDLFANPQTEYTQKLVAAAPATWMKQQEMKDDYRKTKVERGLQPLQSTLELENDIEFVGNSKEPKEDLLRKNVLDVEHLNVYYQERTKGLFSGKEKKQVVKNASLHIEKGESLGIVGESGCGKTTLAKAIAGLIGDTDGEVSIHSETLQEKHETAYRPQMVFQDPYGSLNPARKIGWILEEPLKIRGGFSKEERKAKVLDVIRQVGLNEKHIGRRVSQLSGGQRQRVAIAAALILNPQLIILDEPVSSLDVTVQAQILELLKNLQKQYQLSYLFISHDLNVVYQVCDRICVMYQGEIVETRYTRDLFIDPQNDYTKALLEASIPD